MDGNIDVILRNLNQPTISYYLLAMAVTVVIGKRTIFTIKVLLVVNILINDGKNKQKSLCQVANGIGISVYFCL